LGALTIGVITNPNSRKNAGRPGRAQALQRLLGDRGVVRETRSTDELGHVLEEMRALGVDTWVADGGDGSLHWMLNAKADRYGLGTIDGTFAIPANGGTIDFVARHAGVHGRAEQILPRLIDAIASGTRLPTTDIPTLIMRGVLEGAGGVRRPFERIGFAAAIAGIGSGFFDKYYEHADRGPPAMVDVITRTTAACLLDLGPWRRLAPESWLRYGRTTMGAREARVEVDGVALPYTRYTAINVGAFPINLGGVVKAFQQAGPGRLNVVAGDLAILPMIGVLPRLFTGRPLRSASLHDAAASRVRVVATGETALRPVMDGELIDGVWELEVTPGPSVRVPRIDGRAPRTLG
jgi:hypothetical protein